MSRAYRVQSLSQLRGFIGRRQVMRASLVDDGADADALMRTRLLWHGPTSRAALEGLVQTGFDRLHCSAGLNAFGAGTYFAADAHLAASYATHPHPHAHRTQRGGRAGQ